jgi:hypothetical protein
MATACLRLIRAGRRGRGVVAERSISQGELIERAPDLFIPEAARAAVDPTNVGNYSFNSRAGPPLAEEGPGRRGSRLYEPRRSLARAELQHGRRAADRKPASSAAAFAEREPAA